MSEQTPQLSPEASRDVNNAFDPERRKPQADWEAYLDSRPYEENGKVKNPETDKKIKDADKYFDKKREKHFEGSTKPYENMTPYELTYKIAEAKFNGDKTTERSLYDALLDKIDQEENKPEDEKNSNPQRDNRDLYAEYDHRIDEIFQRLHENEQAQNPEDGSELSEEDAEAEAARVAILDPENVAALRAELAEDESDDSEATPIVPVDPIPPTDPNEVVNGNETPGTDLVLREPMPQNPAERQSWYQRNRERIMGGAALLALAGALAWASLTEGSRDSQRSGSDEKTEQPGKKAGNASKDDVMKKVKFSQNFSDKNHAENKVNAFGGTERGIVDKADFGTLSGDYLDRYLDTHDRMTAHNVEKLVNVRFQEKYGLDATKFNSSWGQQERESMKKEYLSNSGHSLSEAGQKAHKLHMNELRSGKTLKVTAAEAASKYGLDVNSWIKEGKLKGGIDDKAYAAGNTHDAIYITFDDDGNIKHAEIGNCGNEVFSIEGSSSTPLSTPESTPDTDQPDDTFEAIGEIDGDIDWPTGKKKPDEPNKHTGKGNVHVDGNGTSTTGGVGATGPGAEKPHQDAGSQTSDQANEQTGGGTQGSTNPAEGADQGPKPSTPNQGASGETGSGIVSE